MRILEMISIRKLSWQLKILPTRTIRSVWRPERRICMLTSHQLVWRINDSEILISLNLNMHRLVFHEQKTQARLIVKCLERNNILCRWMDYHESMSNVFFINFVLVYIASFNFIDFVEIVSSRIKFNLYLYSNFSVFLIISHLFEYICILNIYGLIFISIRVVPETQQSLITPWTE